MQRRKRGQVTYTAVSKEMAALDITRTSPPRSSLGRRLCGMCASRRKPIPSTTGREHYLPFFLCHLTAGFNPSSRQSLHDGIVKLHRSVACPNPHPLVVHRRACRTPLRVILCSQLPAIVPRNPCPLPFQLWSRAH